MKVFRVKTHPTPRRGEGRKIGEGKGYEPISYEKCTKSHVRQCGVKQFFPSAAGFPPYLHNYAPCHFFFATTPEHHCEQHIGLFNFLIYVCIVQEVGNHTADTIDAMGRVRCAKARAHRCGIMSTCSLRRSTACWMPNGGLRDLMWLVEAAKCNDYNEHSVGHAALQKCAFIHIQSNGIWTDPGPRPLCPYLNKLYTFINTLTNYTSTSNSGNVRMPIKFKFLINPGSIQRIF